jgi:hypothetical protein
MSLIEPINGSDFWDIKILTSVGGCGTHQIDLGAADPTQCPVDGPARLEHDNFVPARTPTVTDLTSVTSGNLIMKSEFDALKSRFDAEKVHWDVATVIPPVVIGDQIVVAHYNNFVNLISEIFVKAKTQTGYWNYYLDNLYTQQSTAKVQGAHITAADWKKLVDDYNTVKNSCVCNKNCSCNAVCGSYQNCRCNGYSTSCVWASDISPGWFVSPGVASPNPDLKNNPLEI